MVWSVGNKTGAYRKHHASLEELSSIDRMSTYGHCFHPLVDGLSSCPRKNISISNFGRGWGGENMEDWIKLVLTGDPRIVTGVVVGALAGVGAGIAGGKVFGNWSLNRKLAAAESQLNDLKASVNDSVFVWLRKPYQRPNDYVAILNNSIPIISVVNLKGGVGKTTIAANLVGFLSQQRRRDGTPLQVLVIDLDYQGSLSSMLYTAAGLELHDTKSHYLVDPSQSIDVAKASAASLRPKFDNVHIYAAFEDFLDTENRLMMEWLIHRTPTHGDIRYEMFKKLQSPGFLDSYDIVIIDCPPRMTTGFVAALTASTHLLMPTIADKLSAPAAIRFLKQLETLRPELFPATKLLGIVPSKIYDADKLTKEEERVLEQMISDLLRQHKIFDIGVFRGEPIPSRASFIKAAGTALAYFDGSDEVPRRAFDRLGRALLDRVKLKR